MVKDETLLKRIRRRVEVGSAVPAPSCASVRYILRLCSFERTRAKLL